MNYKLLNNDNGIIKNREPQIVSDKLHVSFEGLEDVATAIFERDDGESLYRTLCDNKCMLECRWLKGSIKVTVAIFKNTARTKRWFCEGFFAQPVPNSQCVLVYPADTDLQGKEVLDMGCGTSILAILARMRGAVSCTAVDIDDWCVRNSQENIALNHLDGIDVYQGDASSLADKGPFDVVIANINRNILLADMRYYVARMKKGALLFLSGFYTEDIPALRSEAESLGLRHDGQREKNRWATVKFILA